MEQNYKTLMQCQLSSSGP